MTSYFLNNLNFSIMKTNIKFLFTLLILFAFSCSQETTLDPLTTDLEGVSAKTNKLTAPIIDYTLNEIPGASSTLHRNVNGITVNFKTKGLIPGNAYTLWFVVFGDAPGPPLFSTHAAGHIVGGSGNGNFSGHISVGDIIYNPLTAEVHMALRTHRPAQPEMMPDQIQTIDGGCLLPDIGFPSGPMLHPDSDVVGYCANIQVAMHLL